MILNILKTKFFLIQIKIQLGKHYNLFSRSHSSSLVNRSSDNCIFSLRISSKTNSEVLENTRFIETSIAIALEKYKQLKSQIKVFKNLVYQV